MRAEERGIEMGDMNTGAEILIDNERETSQFRYGIHSQENDFSEVCRCN